MDIGPGFARCRITGHTDRVIGASGDLVADIGHKLQPSGGLVEIDSDERRVFDGNSDLFDRCDKEIGIAFALDDPRKQPDQFDPADGSAQIEPCPIPPDAHVDIAAEVRVPQMHWRRTFAPRGPNRSRQPFGAYFCLITGCFGHGGFALRLHRYSCSPEHSDGKGIVMTTGADLVGQIETLGEKLAHARASIANRFIGQERVVDLTLSALVCGGHALLIGLPGLGKTRLVDTLSTVMGLKGNRIQFTPDLMPADILGSEVLETAADGTRSFRFIEGPVFCQLLMADEINRASPRTQSALLQAMQEKMVTIAGQNRALGVPFHVLATQNPIEQEGTYPLPEAQLDRFLVQVDVPYPTRDNERAILMATTGVEEGAATAVFTAAELLAAQTLLRRMPVGEAIVEMILDLVRTCRPDDPTAPQYVRDAVSWGRAHVPLRR